MNHFELLKSKVVNNDVSLFDAYNLIITPVSAYYISNFYLGVEPKNLNLPKSKSKHLKENLNLLKDNDIIFIENNSFKLFVEDFLPNIKTKFVLLTSQTNRPRLTNKILIDTVLNNNFLIVWFSHNPIKITSKYKMLPYGINNGIVCSVLKDRNIAPLLYINELKKNVKKTDNIISLPMRVTHSCRRYFPHIMPVDGVRHDNKVIMTIPDYYKNLHKAKFVLSPIGDREDCYRHWEAIGLGCVPISNVNKNLFKQTLKSSMLYKDCTEMLNNYKNNDILDYNEPNKDLICLSYWINEINKYIKNSDHEE